VLHGLRCHAAGFLCRHRGGRDHAQWPTYWPADYGAASYAICAFEPDHASADSGAPSRSDYSACPAAATLFRLRASAAAGGIAAATCSVSAAADCSCAFAAAILPAAAVASTVAHSVTAAAAAAPVAPAATSGSACTPAVINAAAHITAAACALAGAAFDFASATAAGAAAAAAQHAYGIHHRHLSAVGLQRHE
jgi:hypothetical protein